MPGSAVFKLARASGLPVSDWQNVILVNMLGKRFYDETGDQFTANSAKQIDPYVPGSYLNAVNIKYKPSNFHKCGPGRHRRRTERRRADLGDL